MRTEVIVQYEEEEETQKDGIHGNVGRDDNGKKQIVQPWFLSWVWLFRRRIRTLFHLLALYETKLMSGS